MTSLATSMSKNLFKNILDTHFNPVDNVVKIPNQVSKYQVTCNRFYVKSSCPLVLFAALF